VPVFFPGIDRVDENKMVERLMPLDSVTTSICDGDPNKKIKCC